MPQIEWTLPTQVHLALWMVGMALAFWLAAYLPSHKPQGRERSLLSILVCLKLVGWLWLTLVWAGSITTPMNQALSCLVLGSGGLMWAAIMANLNFKRGRR